MALSLQAEREVTHNALQKERERGENGVKRERMKLERELAGRLQAEMDGMCVCVCVCACVLLSPYISPSLYCALLTPPPFIPTHHYYSTESCR